MSVSQIIPCNYAESVDISSTDYTFVRRPNYLWVSAATVIVMDLPNKANVAWPALEGFNPVSPIKIIRSGTGSVTILGCKYI